MNSKSCSNGHHHHRVGWRPPIHGSRWWNVSLSVAHLSCTDRPSPVSRWTVRTAVEPGCSPTDSLSFNSATCNGKIHKSLTTQQVYISSWMLSFHSQHFKCGLPWLTPVPASLRAQNTCPTPTHISEQGLFTLTKIWMSFIFILLSSKAALPSIRSYKSRPPHLFTELLDHRDVPTHMKVHAQHVLLQLSKVYKITHQWKDF